VAQDLPRAGDSFHLHCRFPRRDREEFEHLLDFMREAEIDRAGCFAYSPVEGATANELPGMLPEEVREARRARSWRWPKRSPPSVCSAAWARS
jgi:hypothetical protein